MANIIDTNGIQTKTRSELIAAMTADLKLVYGDDINVDQNTPDGQLINIFAQAVIDTQDLITQVYNSFDPTSAIGRSLDQRCAINGIQRLGGTHTNTSVQIETDRPVALIGLDLADPLNAPSTVFSVADSEGNIFYLKDSIGLFAGFTDCVFVAKYTGAVQTSPAQITVIKSVVLGVVAVTNSVLMNTILGTNEESDSDLRLRRSKSVSLSSQGYLSSLKAAIENISEVTYSEVYENNTGGVVDGIQGHSIWAIVEGGNDDDIAYAIYIKRNAGCGMKGSVIVPVVQADGTSFDIRFDRTSFEAIYLKFDALAIDPSRPIDAAYIKDQLVSLVGLDVNESVNSNDIASLIRTIDSNCLATNILLSVDDATWLSIVSPSAKNMRFTLAVGNIDITVL